MEKLQHEAGDVSWYSSLFYPYPVAIDSEDLHQFQRLCKVLNLAIINVVNAFFDDVRIRNIIKLSEPHLALLQQCCHSPYQVGSFRPDILLDQTGQWRICEINARFPMNGYLASYYVNRTLSQLPYLPTHLQPISAIEPILDTLLDYFKDAKTITHIKEREKGADIFFFLKELQKRGLAVTDCPLNQTKLQDGIIYANGEPITHAIFELEKDEWLGISPEMLSAWTNKNIFSLNEIRTQLLTHDKRMLAVLSNSEIMSDYLEFADRQFLQKYLIPTYSAADKSIFQQLRNEPQQWILKRNSSGRGIGILVGKECSLESWQAALDHEADDFTAQPYLQQQSVTIPYFKNTSLTNTSMHLVGILPCLNGVLFGPGFFRVSQESIINLYGGRGAVMPMMELDNG
jgi:glutathionylspermidine synthase